MSNPPANIDPLPSVGIEDAGTWYDRGDVLANQGQYQEALTCFEQALEKQPHHHAAWVFRAVMLVYLERYKEALESCDQAIALQPNSPEAWTFRGVALHRMERYQEAYACYDRALGKQRQTLWQSLILAFKRFIRMLVQKRANRPYRF